MGSDILIHRSCSNQLQAQPPTAKFLFSLPRVPAHSSITGVITNLPAARSTYQPHAQPPTAGATLPSILPKAQATWQRQCADLKLLPQTIMHHFGIILVFCNLRYLLPLGCRFEPQLEVPPTTGQQSCLWSGEVLA